MAVLRNGFTIRHDHRIVMGETTRLFTSADDSSFTDVATGEIRVREGSDAASAAGSRARFVSCDRSGAGSCS